MRKTVVAGKWYPGQASHRLGLEPSMCAIGNRPWRPELDGGRWQRTDYVLVQLVGGRGYCETDRCRRLDVFPGDVVFLAPRGWHYYGPRRGDHWPERIVSFGGPAAAGLIAGLGWTTRTPLLHPGDPTAVQVLMEKLVTLADSDERGLVPALLELLLHLEGSEAVGSDIDPGREGLWDLIDGIRDDPCADWDLAVEAGLLGVSPSTLRRDFDTVLGVSPQRYLTEQRMRRAVDLLCEGHAVASVGVEVGFDDPAHFSRRFKDITGRSPRAYLKSIASKSSKPHLTALAYHQR